jgi:hypothetical protein
MVFNFILRMNFNVQFEVYVMSDLWLYFIVTLRGACSLFLQVVFCDGPHISCPWMGSQSSFRNILFYCCLCVFKNVPLKHILQDLSFIFCISSNRAWTSQYVLSIFIYRVDTVSLYWQAISCTVDGLSQPLTLSMRRRSTRSSMFKRTVVVVSNFDGRCKNKRQSSSHASSLQHACH